MSFTDRPTADARVRALDSALGAPPERTAERSARADRRGEASYRMARGAVFAASAA
jgi:hypothetical protein